MTNPEEICREGALRPKFGVREGGYSRVSPAAKGSCCGR